MTTYIRRLGKVSCVERTRRVIMLVTWFWSVCVGFLCTELRLNGRILQDACISSVLVFLPFWVGSPAVALKRVSLAGHSQGPSPPLLPPHAPMSSSSWIENKVLCFSGRFDAFQRQHVERLVMEHGGTVVDSVTQNVSVFVRGARPSPTKVSAAQAF